ncbi:DUF2000 domain-containing protein [Candidatus Micrarchaeota archaeon]|nr:DUF2000 domain-containing protein [Candidatus Micrarchaeota archaeon]
MKIAIVLNENLGPGFLANAAACIASGLFNKEENLLGEQIEGKDITYIPITKIPILILKQNKNNWKNLLERAKKNNLKYMLFTREAQSTTYYADYTNRVAGKPIDQVDIIGLGVLGDDERITKFSGNIALLR